MTDDYREKLIAINSSQLPPFRLDVDEGVRVRRLLADGVAGPAKAYVTAAPIRVTPSMADDAFGDTLSPESHVRIFDKVVLGHNVTQQLALLLFKFGVGLFLFLACLGGVVYLFDRVFG